MDICVLSKEEVGRLDNYQLQPCHTAHTHISSAEALIGLMSTHYRLVAPKCVTECDSEYYVWRNRASGGVKVRQMVPNT